MKQLLFAALLSIVVVACTSDSYDSGDTPLSYLSAEWADVTTNDAGLVAKAVTDDGQQLTLSPPYAADWLKQTADTTCRALLYHGQVVDGVTDVKALSPVMMASVVDRRAGMTLKLDPIGGARGWFSANKKYLNLVLTLKVGYQKDAPTQQKMGLVRDSTTTLADGSRCHWLTLVHDQNGVPAFYSQEACVSVPTTVLPQVGKVCLRVPTASGEQLLEIR